MPPSPSFRPATTHAALGPDFYDPVQPARFPETILRHRNQRWAERVGLGTLDDGEWIAHFGRFAPLPGSFDTPLALRYHGHQFRSYNPDLGDGRGFLFAQLVDPEDGRLLDLATKGSGRTPWSRGADGRLTLKGGVREVLATTMLEALGVDTSKSFSLIETGEELERHDEPSPTRGAVLVRLSHSHIRIGTFQRLAYEGDTANLGRLLEHCVTHYRPDCRGADTAATAALFLERVAADVARTGARWLATGFVHGVLNTDNINITGESFDYGPWRFLPSHDPAFTAAYFDETGLYAFGRQPDTLAWNLTRLAECLLPLGDHAALEAALNSFWPGFQREMASAILDRLALVPTGPEEDAELLTALFTALFDTKIGYERFFFDWRGGADERALSGPAGAIYRSEAFAPLARLLRDREASPSANLDHPYFARPAPRTMLIDEMEALWAPIAARDDWSALEAALAEIEEMRQAYAGTAAAKSSTRPGSSA
ncbi:Uncharacterized conserved protein YdiU, UPF0061 family [Devosia enhydra]|uniref:Protein nucleotidyltransferase YdiU n=1 Tax=Devosia enhydra TaxID=665118 RepID=A0A1K2HYV0_9HYPH|nr:YdiU family protein [Devosia enhydra]SFZ85152.1 Uncharacterized conserved protein YdiU, UPF0061 family [Devosia enhydra]